MSQNDVFFLLKYDVNYVAAGRGCYLSPNLFSNIQYFMLNIILALLSIHERYNYGRQKPTGKINGLISIATTSESVKYTYM